MFNGQYLSGVFLLGGRPLPFIGEADECFIQVHFFLFIRDYVNELVEMHMVYKNLLAVLNVGIGFGEVIGLCHLPAVVVHRDANVLSSQ